MRYTVYKVLKVKKNGSLMSAGNIPRNFKQKYELNRKNYGKIKNSKVFVFKNLKDAVNFRLNNFSNRRLKIFKGKCRSMESISYIPALWDSSSFSSIEEIEKYWSGKPYSKIFTAAATMGCYAASYIYLQEMENS